MLLGLTPDRVGEAMPTNDERERRQARTLGVAASFASIPLGGLAAWGAATSTVLPWLLFAGVLIAEFVTVTAIARRLRRQRYSGEPKGQP